MSQDTTTTINTHEGKLQALRQQYAELLSKLEMAILRRNGRDFSDPDSSDDYHLITRLTKALDWPHVIGCITGLFGHKPEEVDLIAHRKRLHEVMGAPGDWGGKIEDALRAIYNLDLSPLKPAPEPAPGTQGRPLQQEVFDAMENFGGGFVRHLAMAWRRADPANSQTLHHVFGHYYRQYENQLIRHGKAGH